MMKAYRFPAIPESTGRFNGSIDQMVLYVCNRFNEWPICSGS